LLAWVKRLTLQRDVFQASPHELHGDRHRQFRHPLKAGTVTVAGKESADVPAGTLNSVLKHAGLKQEARVDGCSEENDV
jgi:hypothetical protein